jgi:type I restriction enzyme S subunit
VHYQSGKFALANLLVGLEVLRPRVALTKYLWLLLDSQRDQLIVPLMRGTANVNFKPEWLADVVLPLPPLAEQERIVDLIGAVDDTIDAIRAERESARQCLASLGEAEWCIPAKRTLGEVGTAITGKTPSTKVREYWEPPTIPFVTPGDIGDGLFVQSVDRGISQLGGAEARLLPSATVVHVCIGATIGKVGVLTAPSVSNQQINALVGLDEVDATFVALILSAPSGVGLTKDTAGQTTLPLLKKSAWVQLPVPWPERPRREFVASCATELDRVAIRAALTNDKSRDFRAALLAQLLSGNYQVPSSYDCLLEAV